MTHRKPKPSARAAVLGLLSLVGLLATGCVNLPANSGVNNVSKQTDAGGGSDVRIWPQGPKPKEDSTAIVEGFLQTAANDPSNLSIARQYLAGDAPDWDPRKVVVFGSDETSPAKVPGHPDEVQITGTVIAKIDDDGSYQPMAATQPHNPTTYTFVVKNNPAKGYAQITQLPADFGIALTQETFRAEYNAYGLYYLNAAEQADSMIPVPVYLRNQSDGAIAQKLADKLLDGPPPWLDGAAVTAAPQIALSSQSNAVSIAPDGTAQVTVKTPNYCTTRGSGSACTVLADELLATYSDLASVSRVTIVDQHGTQLGQSTGAVDVVMRHYHVGLGGPGNSHYYYLSKDNTVYSVDSKGTNRPVQVGPASRRYNLLAVTSYNLQTVVAAVDTSGSKLYLGEPGVNTDRQPTFSGGQISSLSWDALGHLWFIDKTQNGTDLYRVDVTQGLEAQPQMINTIGTDGDSMTIEQIAAAPDGRRVAVVYTAGSPLRSVGIGVFENSSTGLSLGLPQAVENPVVSQWNTVLDVDWHGSQYLAVLGGQQSSSPSVISELYPDGSPVINSTDLNAITINPPTSTTSIDWTGNTLLAAYGSGPTQQITQYLSSSSSSTSQAIGTVQGSSPSYVN